MTHDTKLKKAVSKIETGKHRTPIERKILTHDTTEV